MLPATLVRLEPEGGYSLQDAITTLRCDPLQLTVEQAQDRVDDTMVTVRSYGEIREVTGFRASKIIPFRGEPRLWFLQPNSYDSCPPMGKVSAHNLTLAVSVPKGDTSQVPDEIARTLRSINKYLAWQASQLKDYNEQVEARVQSALRAAEANNAAKQELLARLSGSAS